MERSIPWLTRAFANTDLGLQLKTHGIHQPIAVLAWGTGPCSWLVRMLFGPPADHDGTIAVLREVVKLGINHIDTSDFYGPHITNQLIKEALHPYPEVRGGRPEGEPLRIVTKVGTRKAARAMKELNSIAG